MNSLRILALFWAPLVLAQAKIACADEVTLANGDRLSGKVLRKSGDKLTLHSEHAADIVIDWSSVASIVTDLPVELILTDDRRLRSRLGEPPLAEADRRRAELEGGSGTVGFDEIVYINPTPEESGIGYLSSGHASASLAMTSGNSSGTRNYADADFTARAKRFRWGLSGKANRVTDSGELTASNWLAAGHYDRFVAEDHFLYVRASAEHDPFKDIDLRTAAGGGYGFQLAETDRANASVRGGLDYIVIDHIDNPNEHYPALGWGFKLTYKLDGTDRQLFHDDDGFWDLHDLARVTFRSRTGLRLPLVGNLTANFQLNLDWDSKPAEGRKPTDTTLLIGLGYTF